MLDGILKNSSVMPRLSISLPDEDMVPEHLREAASINSSSIGLAVCKFSLTQSYERRV